MTHILAVSASPTRESRTAALVQHAIDRLSLTGFDAGHLVLRELPAEELLGIRRPGAVLRSALEDVAVADGLIVATPVYKAAYTGLLKTFLDLLPQSGLAGKTVLPLATGGGCAHVLAIDYALRPVLTALRARHVVGGCYQLEDDIARRPDGSAQIRPEAELRLFDAIDDFIEALPASTAAGSAPLPQ
ncbi:NADPH-dependent FMN reductase [Streptomyces xiamenensis]|uniref:NADPH-dependent FMN reductase n=1 Tax=Streptomyces xiamenensis TaxID=408015 RepID=UPI0035D5B394